MTQIAIERGGAYAPCSYIICKVIDGDWNERDDKNTVLVQTDWEFPGVASAFGFTPCDCGETDGTVDCPHKTATEMITAAAEYLDDCEGKVVDDPGYFEEQT